MKRCSFIRRFVTAFLLCSILNLATGARGFADDAGRTNEQAGAAQAPVVPTPQGEAQTAEPTSSEQQKAEQYVLPPDRYEKAVSYSRAGYTLYFISFFFNVVVLLLILRLGVAAKFRDLAERASDKCWVQAVVFVPVLVVTLEVLQFPLHAYWHALSLRYEISVQGWSSWLWDWTKGTLLGMAFALIFLLILFTLMRKSPRRWWVYFWFVSLPILMFLVFVSPWVIDPLFHQFEPLETKHADLVAAIEKLTKHAGVPIARDRMFLMKASTKTTSIDAYVTGLGASKRVVVFDTLVQKSTTDEALFVVGHELGHYVLGHVRKGFMFFAGLLLVALYLLFRGLHWSLGRWSKDWKIYGPEDWASAAVILLLLQVMAFLVSPVVNGFSRMQEHAADVYGLEVIHGIVPNSAEVAARSFQKLGEIDLADPNPSAFITFWLYSHPPLAERLVFAHSYDPWSKGEPPRYVK